MSSMKLQCNLKQILESKKISLYRLQKDTGVSINNLRAYRENSNKQFNREVIIKICVAVSCDISDLFTLVEDN